MIPTPALLMVLEFRRSSYNRKLTACASPFELLASNRCVVDESWNSDVFNGPLAALVIDIKTPAIGFSVAVDSDGVVGSSSCIDYLSNTRYSRGFHKDTWPLSVVIDHIFC